MQASDDSGHIHYMDSRKEKKAVFTLQAHTSAVTGVTQCHGYNGCLVTVAMDSLLKVWDTSNQKPTCILEKKFADQVCCLPCVMFGRNDTLDRLLGKKAETHGRPAIAQSHSNDLCILHT